MGSFARLPASALRRRIDAEYYRPEYVANEARLLNARIGRAQLQTLVTEGRRCLYFGTNTLESSEAPTGWVPFLTADDFGDDGLFIELNSRRLVSPSFLDDYPHGRLRAGELLVKVKGPNQLAAYIDTAPGFPVLLSGTIWGAIVRKDLVDPHYLVTALSSNYGSMARSRLRTNLNVEFTSAEDLLSLEVPVPHREAQRYIGDKVRQAERLREKGKKLERDLVRPFDSLVSDEVLRLGETRSWRVSSVALAARLDPGANHIRLASLRAELKRYRGVTALRNLIRLPIPSGIGISDFTETGPLYVRIADFDSGYWDYSAAAVAQKDHAANNGAQVQPCDVVFARIGNTLGKVGFADSFVPPSSISNNCSLLRPTSPSLGAWVFWCLRSRLGQIQVNCLRSQTAQPKIAHEDIEEIFVPVPDPGKLAMTAAATESRFRHARMSDGLVSAATLLVETLIEGKVSESDLISAQQALERGDRSADKAILQRLTRKGIDIPVAPPLFPDVDALYALLDSVDQPETAQ